MSKQVIEQVNDCFVYCLILENWEVLVDIFALIEAG